MYTAIYNQTNLVYRHHEILRKIEQIGIPCTLHGSAYLRELSLLEYTLLCKNEIAFFSWQPYHG